MYPIVHGDGNEREFRLSPVGGRDDSEQGRGINVQFGT